MDELSLTPNEAHVAKAGPGKTNSQFTKTWFIDRHIEAMISYTDGTHYTYPTEYMNHTPRHGDPKHYEWVWRNNQWLQTVGQIY